MAKKKKYAKEWYLTSPHPEARAWRHQQQEAEKHHAFVKKILAGEKKARKAAYDLISDRLGDYDEKPL